MIKNKYYLAIGLAVLMTACSQPEGFELSGDVPEAWDGKQVVLYTKDTGRLEAVDSAQVKNGHFRIKGQFEMPRLCQLNIYLDPDNRKSYDMTPSFEVYLDSTIVKATAERVNKDVSFIVKEGDTNKEWQSYKNQVKQYSAKRKLAFDHYLEAFYQLEQEKEGMEAAMKVTERTEELAQFRKDYIHSNVNSFISLQVFQELLESSASFHRQEMRELYEGLNQKSRETVPGKLILEKINSRKIEEGAPCPEVSIADRTGKIFSLTQVLPEGKYTLVELWASWCSPCRGEIPFLKRAYQKYHSKGFEIISISINERTEDWLEALDQENMPWKHYIDCAQKSFEAFETQAVPTSLLIGPDGKIFKTNARGGWLDLALKEIFE